MSEVETKLKADAIIKETLGELAAIECTKIEHIDHLERGKVLFDRAILSAREDYYQQEVHKQREKEQA
jgi:hypothetical protein